MVVPFQFSVSDILALLDAARKIYVAFDEGPRGAVADYDLLCKEYAAFFDVFASLEEFFKTQDDFRYDFGALKLTLDRLEKVLAKSSVLKDPGMSMSKVKETVAYPFKKNEVKNIRQHLSRHSESLMLYFAQQTLIVSVDAKAVVASTHSKTGDIHDIVSTMNAKLDSLLLHTTRGSSVSPSPRFSPLALPAEDNTRLGTEEASYLLPTAMLSPPAEPSSNPESPDAEVVELPTVASLTHISPSDIETIRALLKERLAEEQRDSAVVLESWASSPTFSRMPTLPTSYLGLPPSMLDSTRRVPHRRSSSNAQSSEPSPTSTPPVRQDQFRRPSQGASQTTGPQATSTTAVQSSESSESRQISRTSTVAQIEHEWDFLCSGVYIVSSQDESQTFTCRMCPGSQRWMTLKKRIRSNGNIKLQLSCSKCGYAVLEHECRADSPLIPYTFYAEPHERDSRAVFFNTCSGHAVPGYSKQTKPKYIFKHKADFVGFQELMYRKTLVDSWNVDSFTASDGQHWQNEAVRLFKEDDHGLAMLFPFVLSSNRTGFFDASRDLIEEVKKTKPTTLKVRLKKPRDLPKLVSRSPSIASWSSDNSTSSTISVAASCISFDDPNPDRNQRPRLSSKPIVWEWIELTFQDQEGCTSFLEHWKAAHAAAEPGIQAASAGAQKRRRSVRLFGS